MNKPNSNVPYKPHFKRKQMKNKICKYCKKVMDYEEWKRESIIVSDWHWKVKRFCNHNCSRLYWLKERG